MIPSAQIRKLALEAGFDLCRVARAAPLENERARLTEFLSEGRQGNMGWLEKEPERFTDPARVLDGCRSVIVLAHRYLTPEALERDNDELVVAKYALGRDYHLVISEKLDALASKLEQRWPGAAGQKFCDHGPVMEKAWAVRSGIGVQGRNSLIINPEHGSFLFLGVILTDLEIEPNEPLDFDPCMGCAECIKACPTGALNAKGLNAEKCISYLTLEHKGEFSDKQAEMIGNRILGCDICQDVCPHNVRAIDSGAAFTTELQFKPDPRLSPLDAEWVLSLGSNQFMREFAESAFKRPRKRGVERNLSAVKKNRANANQA